MHKHSSGSQSDIILSKCHLVNSELHQEGKTFLVKRTSSCSCNFFFHVIVAVVAVTSLENNLSSYYKPSRNTHHNTAPPDDPVNSRINVVALTPDNIFVTPN